MPSNPKIKTIKDVVAKAEKQLAYVRQYAHGTEIPTINELRYTLYHLLCYLEADNEEEWEKSHRHARRALFDAYDAEAQFLSMKFVAFEEQHKDMVIGDIVPAISTWRMVIGSYTEFSRETDRDHREDYYENMKPHIAAIRPIISRLPQASDDLNKKRQENLDKRAREIKMLRWTIVVAVLTVFAVATSIVVEYRKANEERTASPQTTKERSSTSILPDKQH